MNPNRLLSIIMFLLVRKRRISIPELAKIFGVATRTIYRDIDVMTAAGIPILNLQLDKDGIALDGEFIKKFPDASDIVEIILSITEMYPKLLESRAYALAQYRRLTAGNPASKPQTSAVIQATVRFFEQYQDEIGGLYDLYTVSRGDDGCVTAKIYISNNENEFNALLLLGNKCQCTSPAHVREYIKNKIKEINDEYSKI